MTRRLGHGHAQRVGTLGVVVVALVLVLALLLAACGGDDDHVERQSHPQRVRFRSRRHVDGSRPGGHPG